MPSMESTGSKTSTSTTAHVRAGLGAEDSVSAGISSSNIAVTDPVDGWVSFYANDIEIAGTITATGRGYGGGGGGGAGVRGGYQGYGGSVGLGGDGGPASTSYAGAGGGGSPGGAGGVGATRGGAGNMYGGGGGSTGCSGSNGRDGGDGSTGTTVPQGNASSGSPGAAGQGEFEAGGGQGVVAATTGRAAVAVPWRRWRWRFAVGVDHSRSIRWWCGWRGWLWRWSHGEWRLCCRALRRCRGNLQQWWRGCGRNGRRLPERGIQR